MAENILETRLLLRYGTYSQWMNSTVILMQGEAAVASFPYSRTIANSNDTPENTPPAIGIKIGDGFHRFDELPWVQGVAADVYAWAKQVNKPTYTANEIQGLQSYIESHIGGGGSSGSGTVTPRVYQLVAGTGTNSNKYYLQYRENTNDEWTVDTEHYIDLEAFAKIAEWIGEDVDNFTSLGNRTEDHIQYDLGLIKYNDSQQGSLVVTAVSQNKAKINVTKRQLGFTDIGGTAPVEKGGTGQVSFESGEVLVGNNTGPLKSMAVDTELAANNHLAYNYAVKSYVDNAVAGLEGAMHFVGDATVEPTGATDPRISDYNFRNARPGDVVLWEQKEYVWTGMNWRLLGDEGSYAVKGSIRDADIDAEAEIQQSKIANLTDDLDAKIDKESGKGLSSNDYTNEDKAKLDGIEDGAQANVIEHILVNDVEAVPHTVNNVPNVVELAIKEFDDTSRAKLNSIEEGAQVNSIESISINGTAQGADNNKNINLTINEFTDEYQRKLESIEAGAQVNAVERIYVNGTEAQPNQDKRVDILINEPTTEQLEKIDSVEYGAEVNTIERITVDGQEIGPDQNRTVNIQTDPHLDHVNKIESISVNGTEFLPDANKAVNIRLSQDLFDLNVIEGAEVPNGQGGYSDVDVVSRKLRLAAIANSGDVKHLTQTQYTYIILNCGSSTEVI